MQLVRSAVCSPAFWRGLLADRFYRRSLMIASDLLSGIAVVTMLVFPHPLCIGGSRFFQRGFLHGIPGWLQRLHSGDLWPKLCSSCKCSPKASSLASDMREVWSYVRLYPIFLLVSLVSLFYTFSTAGYNFGLPLLSTQLENGTATAHGMMWAFLSIGSLAGSFIVSRFKVNL